MKHLDFIKHELGIDYIVNPDLATARATEVLKTIVSILVNLSVERFKW